jgi:hypothetical protein
VIDTLGQDGEGNLVAARVQQTVFFEELGDDYFEFVDQFLEVSAPVAKPGTSSLDATQTSASPSHSALMLYERIDAAPSPVFAIFMSSA